MNKYKKYSKSIKGRERRKRYKNKNFHKTKAQNIALYLYPEVKNCSVSSCKNVGERHHPDYKQPDKIVWLCRAHHKILHYPIKLCEKIGCDRRSHARGLCNKHYMAYLRDLDKVFR